MPSVPAIHKRCLYLTVVGLTALCLLSIYVLFLSDFPVSSHYHSDTSISPNSHANQRRLERLGRVVRNQEAYQHPLSAFASTATLSTPIASADTQHRLQLLLTPKQELAALASFLAAHEQHALPAETELDAPLNPDLILDFDSSAPRAHEELSQLQLDVWQYNPIVLFGKSLQPATRRLREALAAMNLRVEETVIELDTRDDGAIIESALRRLVPESSAQLPVLILNGEHVLIDVHEQGRNVLRSLLSAAGALRKEAPSRWHRELKRREARWSVRGDPAQVDQ